MWSDAEFPGRRGRRERTIFEPVLGATVIKIDERTTCLIDGEAITCTEAGLTNFDGLRHGSEIGHKVPPSRIFSGTAECASPD